MLTTVRHHLHRCAWLAFFAIFGLAFAPAISHALVHAAGEPDFTQVCTPQGLKTVAIGAAQGAPASGVLPHLDHCPLCGLTSVPVVPLSANPGMILLPIGSADGPPARSQPARCTPPAWASLPARAPPL